jgi:tRNA (guanine26-N2/guanine27-N2)-dimethyltransferase
MNANYEVSYSHCSKNSIKTNAPSEIIWDLLRERVRNKPIVK